MLGISVLAVLASCKKEASIVSDVLEIINAPSETTIAKEGTENPIVVTFKASKPWTAAAEQGNGDFVTLSPKSGDPADVCTLKVNVAENDTEADRDFKVIIQSEGLKPIELSFTQQSQFHMNIATTEYNVSKDGDEFTITVDANVDFTVTDYSDKFTWQHVAPSNDGKTYKVTIDANTSRTPRQSYIKFTSSAIQVPVNGESGEPTGETKDLAIRVYFTQAGLATLVWQKSLTAYGSVATVGGVHRLLINEGQPVLSDGSKMHLLDANTGNILYAEELSADNVTTDDAGNLIYAAATSYLDTLNIHYITADAEEEGILITYNHNEVYSTSLSNIRVKGDIKGDALVVAFTDLYVYAVCWEIKDGEVKERVLVPLPTIADWTNWTGIVWQASRNGCVVPVSTSLEDGLLYIAYDGRYVLTKVDTDGTETEIYSPYDVPAEEGGNENFNCISTTIWNGAYMVAFERGQFFSYGNCTDFYLLDQANNTVDYFDHNLFGVNTTYLGTDDGENASSDILLYPESNGDLSVYVVDALADVIYKVKIEK